MKKLKEFHIQKAILFGSRVKGNYLKDSDIDLILVSDDFNNIFFTDRISKVSQSWEGKIPLEVFCYTNKEFKKKRKMFGIVREAVREGILLK